MLALFFLSVCCWFSGMAYNVYHICMHDEQCWALLPGYTLFFISNAFFSTQTQCCLTFSKTEVQILLRCCLMHISIIILRLFIYLLYLCSCLHLGLFMPYLHESIFIFVFIFIMIDCIISWIQTCLFLCLFFRICPVIVWW